MRLVTRLDFLFTCVGDDNGHFSCFHVFMFSTIFSLSCLTAKGVGGYMYGSYLQESEIPQRIDQWATLVRYKVPSRRG